MRFFDLIDSAPRLAGKRKQTDLMDGAQSLTEKQATRLDRGTGQRMLRKPACDGCGNQQCADVRRERDALAAKQQEQQAVLNQMRDAFLNLNSDLDEPTAACVETLQQALLDLIGEGDEEEGGQAEVAPVADHPPPSSPPPAADAAGAAAAAAALTSM